MGLVMATGHAAVYIHGVPMALRFPTEQRERLRRDLMKRGRNLATLLADVMAGKRPPSLAAMLAEKPGARPEEVLRLALDQVEGRRKLLDADDDRFGRCDVCGADLGDAGLGEMPWADRCQAHAHL
jgi:RNA polymerase-binding transcription factor DksA